MASLVNSNLRLCPLPDAKRRDLIRIFSYLAVFALVVNLVTVLLGFSADIESEPSQMTVHFLFGLLSAMAVMLVEGIAVTYFIGTTRWCKEVVETYSLDHDLIARGTRLKRRAFPWAVLTMLTMIAVAALGAAADPQNTLVRDKQFWSMPHMVAALAAMAILASAFYLQRQYVEDQHQVIQDVLAEVQRIRTERGLA